MAISHSADIGRSSQLPRSLKNLRQDCLRLIVNVDGSLGLVAVPTTQTITPIFHGCGRCPGSAVEFQAVVMRRQRRRLPVLRGALAPSSLELPSRRVTGEKLIRGF